MVQPTAVLRRRGLLGVLLAAALAFSTIPASPASALDIRERRMIKKHNRERVTRGIHRLKVDHSLSRTAERHSWAMARQGDLYHSSCLSCRFDGYTWSIGGENVGVGAAVWRLHQAFMASASHRRNILNRQYRKIGVGVVESGGRLWVTVLFYG